MLNGAVSATPCPSSIDETYHRVEVPLTTGSSVVMRSASCIPRDGQRELGHVAVGEGVGLCLVGPEVQVCLLLLVGAEGDVVDVRLPGFRAVGEGNVGEPVALVVREPRGQPDRPGAGGLHQRARNPGEEGASRHVDGVLNGCRRVCREVDQPRARGRDEQCEVDAGGADARPRRPLVGGCRRAVGVEREQRDGDGRVEQRVPVDPPPGVGVGEADGDAEDVGAVAGGGPVGVDVRAAWRRPAARQAHRDAGRAVVVVEEVGPEQRAAGEAAGAAGARELLAERPSGRCRKRGLGPSAPRQARLRASHRPRTAPTAVRATPV